MREPEILKKWLDERGHSQQWLADKLNSTKQIISYHLTSTRNELSEPFKIKLALAGMDIPEIGVKTLVPKSENSDKVLAEPSEQYRTARSVKVDDIEYIEAAVVNERLMRIEAKLDEVLRALDFVARQR